MSGEKTEQPSAKKLRDARKKGQVAKSQDVPSALTTIGVAVYLLAMGEAIFTHITEMASIPMLVMNLPFEEAFAQAIVATISYIVTITLPFVALVMFLGFFANVVQVGVLFSGEAAMPKLTNLSPSKWFKKVFSIKNVIEFLKNILKVLVIGNVVYNIFIENSENSGIYEYYNILEAKNIVEFSIKFNKLASLLTERFSGKL